MGLIGIVLEFLAHEFQEHVVDAGWHKNARVTLPEPMVSYREVYFHGIDRREHPLVDVIVRPHNTIPAELLSFKIEPPDERPCDGYVAVSVDHPLHAALSNKTSGCVAVYIFRTAPDISSAQYRFWGPGSKCLLYCHFARWYVQPFVLSGLVYLRRLLQRFTP